MTRLEALLASGELVAKARTASTLSDLASAVGMTHSGYESQRRRIIKAGRPFPDLAALKRAAQGFADSDAVIRKSDNRIGPSIPNEGTGVPILGTAEEVTGKWPSVAAFDAGQDEPPLPSIPQGHAVRGVSSLVDADGQIKAQWIKTSADDRSRDALLEAWTQAVASSRGVLDPIRPPEVDCDDDLLATYLLGDAHVGMYAWKEDAGANFDLEIAERNLVGAVDRLAGLAPAASHGLIINIGDYFHSDSRSNTTTKGTPVDVDGRWPKVIATGIRIMRRCIDRALQVHRHVTVINEIGNHDTHSSVMLSIALAQFYEREPRVTIDTSPEVFHWFRFGQNLIGTHHGHLVKPKDLLGVIVVDRAQDWAETLYRYFYGGHIHHERVQEFPGFIFESLRSPATSDAWHRGQGYRSGHDIKMDVLHRTRGRINRHIVGIQQLVARTA